MAPGPPLLIAALLLAAGATTVRGRPAGGDVRGAGCLACHATHAPARGECVACHRGDPLAGRVALAHHRLLSGRVAEHVSAAAPAVRAGERRVEQLACRRCHSIGGRGNRLATDLDRIAWQREQAGLAGSLDHPVENMPRFGLEPAQTEALLAYLLHSADPAQSEATYRVRFARTGESGPPLFARECGGCHRALLAGGAAGTGSDGPNLSGLFSGFYPETAPQGRPWTTAALVAWLESPRAARPLTLMRPVPLDADERRRLLAELGAEEVTDVP